MRLSRSSILLGLLGLVVLGALLGASGIAGWEYSNSDAFCADTCHGVHPENTYAHHGSQHARVACVECHMGRVSTFESMARKASHSTHLWGMLTGYERPLTAPSMPASGESCEGCHSSQPHQYDALRVRKRYASDEASTETIVQVRLHTASARATTREADAESIRWHAENQVRFVAADPERDAIRWVEVTQPDGSTVRYVDPKHPPTEDELDEPKREMSCVDCHNRVGHPFRSPEAVLDDALAEGRLNRSFPWVKARALEILEQEFETPEEARQVVEEAYARYLEDFPDLRDQFPQESDQLMEFLDERQAFVADLALRTRFLAPGVSWRSFPDHGEHRYSAGCFRCHNGRLVTEDEVPIGYNCTSCHDIPRVTREGEPSPPPPTGAGLSKIPSHREPDFMSQHYLLLDETCSACHGEIEYGSDNASFCSNPTCHGTRWTHLAPDAP